MLSIAVCDDELLECLDICAKIKTCLEELKIPYTIKQFCRGKELLLCLNQFDLIFLDILMDEMDGMETARRCRELAYEKMLVFLSSSRRYVFEAYDVEAFHYLVKPVSQEKLKSVLKRAADRERSVFQEYIIASQKGQRRKLFLDRILYFEMKGRQVDVHEEKEIITYYEQIGTLEKQLLGKGFFRCHKSYMVNLKHVDGYNRQEAILDNGERILMAKRRYEEFCQAILSYMRKNGGLL